MLRTLSLGLLLFGITSSSALAVGFIDSRIGSLIAEQPSSPVRLLDCKAGYNPLTGTSSVNPSFEATSSAVKSVSIRFALIGPDRRVVDEATSLFEGKYSPGIVINPRRALFLARSYADGTGLCSVSAVQLFDGTRWKAGGSDRPWNPFSDILWGDEPQ